MSIQVVVVGACGQRLGGPVCQAILDSSSEFKLVAAVESPAVVAAMKYPSGFGGALFTRSFQTARDELYKRTQDVTAEQRERAVVFYATRADALLPCLREARLWDFHTHVIGTTGLDETTLQAIKELAGQGNRIVLAPNFSLGAWIGAEQCANLASQLPDAEVEIIETHHDQKEDSPSGTALLWARAVAAARGQDLDDVVIYGRHGKSKRTPEQVGIHSIRGGKVPGNHRAIFFSPDDEVVIEHNVRSGGVFAQGALTAIRWAAEKKEAGLYGMSEVLGLQVLQIFGVS